MATKKTAATSVKPVECRLKKLYTETVVPQLIKEFGYKNCSQRRMEKSYRPISVPLGRMPIRSIQSWVFFLWMIQSCFPPEKN